jgi:hypothetical protein
VSPGQAIVVEGYFGTPGHAGVFRKILWGWREALAAARKARRLPGSAITVRGASTSDLMRGRAS